MESCTGSAPAGDPASARAVPHTSRAALLLFTVLWMETMMSHDCRARAEPLAWPEPTSESRPWTRWWWHGAAVDEANLTRLLEEYRRAGLGGVEVTPIYGVKGQEHRDIEYLSDRYAEVLVHTCAEAKRLGMQVDSPPGSGWKMGGAYLREGERNAEVVIEEHELNAGDGLPDGVDPKRGQAVVAFGPGGQCVDMSYGSKTISGAEPNQWRAPSAGWTLYTVTQRWNKEKIKRAGRGGTGPTLNPASRASFEALKPPYDAFFEKLPEGALRAQFHDSFEYAGNWCAELFDEFEKRRGYDLRTQLPALTGKGDPDLVERVKADYRKTYGELVLDNVIAPWVEWCHGHGQLARNQAHGSPGNLLDLYAVADIPETELFRAPDEWTPIMSKFASSAAHVIGRRLCSSESCTWLGEHFHVALAQAKEALDYQLLSGINHNVYHGTAYSPADAEWPGWLFYAATQFNPQNSIWRDFGKLNEYLTRCQSVLQAGEPDNEVLLYWPVDDVLHHTDEKQLRPQYTVHHTHWFRDHAFGQLAKQLWDRGYSFDYVSDRRLAAAAATPNGIRLPGATYRALVVPRCDHVPLATMRRFLDLARQGATVIFQDRLPDDVPGLGRLEERRRQLHGLCASAKSTPESGVRRVAESANSVILLGREVGGLLAEAGIEREAMVEQGLRFVRRRYGEGWQYFVVNQGHDTFNGWAPLATPAATVAIMDPMAGAVGLAAVRTGGRGCEVRLQLAPGESVILRTFADKGIASPPWRYRDPAGSSWELRGTWQVEFLEGGPDLPPSFQTAQLASWTDPDGAEAKCFAGMARHKLSFDSPDLEVGDWQLDLGEVHESARVRLNDEDRGTFIAAPFALRTGKLKPRGNVLEVEVTNLAANRLRDLDRRGVEWRLFHDINFISRDNGKFDASEWPLCPSGLLGPVRLTPLKDTQR